MITSANPPFSFSNGLSSLTLGIWYGKVANIFIIFHKLNIILQSSDALKGVDMFIEEMQLLLIVVGAKLSVQLLAWTSRIESGFINYFD